MNVTKGSNRKFGAQHLGSTGCHLMRCDVRKIAWPIASMYGTFTYMYYKNQPNEGKYAIHNGWYRWEFLVDYKQQTQQPHLLSGLPTWKKTSVDN